MSQNAISIKGVSKKYTIGKQKDGSLRGTLSSLFSGNKNSQDEFWALKDVSFDIQKGDVVGIIGKNGAGKSTLLKILSQITKPTEGEIEINGRIASLLEVGTGFHPELTGRENVYLNGTILGMTRKEVAAKFDEIVAFSGIEQFIDTPVKHYSSGMYVRLAFAVAAHLEPEILIIDEVLAVGDAEFQKKCLGKMEDVSKNQGRTVLFVSHNMGTVASLCTKSILIEKGQVTFSGETKEVISEYVSRFEYQNELQIENVDSDIVFKKITTVDSEGNFKNVFAHSEPINVKMEIEIQNFIESQNIEVCLLKNDGTRIFSVNKPVKSLRKNQENTMTVVFTIDGGLIAPNHYSFFCALNSKTCTPAYHFLENICPITIYDDGTELSFAEGLEYGVIIIEGSWDRLEA